MSPKLSQDRRQQRDRRVESKYVRRELRINGVVDRMKSIIEIFLESPRIAGFR